MMNVNLVIHRQLNARDILVVGDRWKELYDFFQEGAKKYGIYFYNLKDDRTPFYIGKCTAKSFNILGRVWDELDDCERAASWLGKEISLIEEFKKFNEGEPEVSSLNPFRKIAGKNQKKRIKRFLDNLMVTFTYLDIKEESRVLDKIISDLEIMLQDKLIERDILSTQWVDMKDLEGPDHSKDYMIHPVYNIQGSYIQIDETLFS
jgi:hypothetical protein